MNHLLGNNVVDMGYFVLITLMVRGKWLEQIKTRYSSLLREAVPQQPSLYQ
ncbi:hypothetical protein M089_5311 [Bacteroides ovatus str. 3725 D9 iii]|nr:hypothetical protein M089_5311 [Bacteroides ovatus str. 3725 D9 iii]KDS23121.1 hypothetical protein M088_5695 [Bacteroides ovatus str. 3725 D1 iv]